MSSPSQSPPTVQFERTKQYQHGEGVGSLLADTRYFRLDALHATSCPNYLNTTTEMEIRRQAASLVSLRISRHSASRSTPLPHLQQIPVGFASCFTIFRKSLRRILRYGCCNQAWECLYSHKLWFKPAYNMANIIWFKLVCRHVAYNLKRNKSKKILNKDNFLKQSSHLNSFREANSINLIKNNPQRPLQNNSFKF